VEGRHWKLHRELRSLGDKLDARSRFPQRRRAEQRFREKYGE